MVMMKMMSKPQAMVFPALRFLKTMLPNMKIDESSAAAQAIVIISIPKSLLGKATNPIKPPNGNMLRSVSTAQLPNPTRIGVRTEQ